ncbi:hypothetical protein E3E31_05375 [Thermococcus sp. M39]|uniref:hypothetical protein n=1 Tax=unclassified Thermococcus TaxID=2627626 RepID=UPI00143BD6E1|nr:MULTISPECIES: hypothetical protein [unclassified Thermococcus]NJE07956.1 hypothetical protein [Thermococcus sp. M39]
MLKNLLVRGFIVSLFVIISIFVLFITGQADMKDAVSALTCYILASIASIAFYLFASRYSKLASLPEHLKDAISVTLAVGVFSSAGALIFGYKAWAFPLLPILLVYAIVLIIANYEHAKNDRKV